MSQRSRALAMRPGLFTVILLSALASTSCAAEESPRHEIAGTSVDANVSLSEVVVNNHDIVPLMLLHCTVCHGVRKQEADLPPFSIDCLVRRSKPASCLRTPWHIVQCNNINGSISWLSTAPWLLTTTSLNDSSVSNEIPAVPCCSDFSTAQQTDTNPSKTKTANNPGRMTKI